MLEDAAQWDLLFGRLLHKIKYDKADGEDR
jgi:hypothetical protein